MKHHQIVIPHTLRTRILDIAHKHPQGITKTIALLREKVWWLPTTKCEPLLMTELPTRPWEKDRFLPESTFS